jgi:Domain of unknown function (DUF4390)
MTIHSYLRGSFSRTGGMTVFFMRFCRRHSRLFVLAVMWLLVAIPLAAVANGIEVRKAELVAGEKGYFLEAQFDITLTHTLEEALNKGVPLYFLLDFELVEPRWFWFDAPIATSQHEFRLSFNSLTRQYRVGVGTLYENFATLREAMGVLRNVRVGEIAGTESLSKGTRYSAAVRMRLDGSQLPRPFQVSAVGSREWSVSSDWFRWTVTP